MTGIAGTVDGIPFGPRSCALLLTCATEHFGWRPWWFYGLSGSLVALLGQRLLLDGVNESVAGVSPFAALELAAGLIYLRIAARDSPSEPIRPTNQNS